MKRFTLLELMIVVAIIGILITILLPSLEKTKERTKRALCLSNLSQLYKGTLQVAQKSNNKMPYGVATIGPNRGVFAVRLKSTGYWYGHGVAYRDKYLTDGREYYCPSATREEHQYGYNPGGYGGGFPEPGFPLPDRIYSSYVYRDTFEHPNRRPAWLHTDDPSEAFSADQISQNYSVTWAHKEGHNVLSLGGHAKWNSNKSLLYLNIRNTSPADHENLFWRKVSE